MRDGASEKSQHTALEAACAAVRQRVRRCIHVVRSIACSSLGRFCIAGGANLVRELSQHTCTVTQYAHPQKCFCMARASSLVCFPRNYARQGGEPKPYDYDYTIGPTRGNGIRTQRGPLTKWHGCTSTCHEVLGLAPLQRIWTHSASTALQLSPLTPKPYRYRKTLCS